MAVIWEKRTALHHYQVRQAGRSLRLYTDGTFHSQYNPAMPLDGSIWDLLVLPALFQPGAVDRVLVLGVGGGAVIRQLDQLLAPSAITGVELDPIHLQVARDHFGLAGMKRVRLVQANALVWLKRYRGRPFDLIIDDLFVENGGRPHRALALDGDWTRALLGVLAPGGSLVVNMDSARALRASAPLTVPQIRASFPSCFSLSIRGYDNRVGAFFQSPVTRRQLSDNLRLLEQQFGKALTRKLRARIRQL